MESSALFSSRLGFVSFTRLAVLHFGCCAAMVEDNMGDIPCTECKEKLSDP